MRKYPLSKEDKLLMKEAERIVEKNYNKKGSVNSSVGCALMSSSGKVYGGINLHNLASSPASIDAEEGAIDQMITQGERKILTIVSIHKRGKKIDVFQPCGHCRQAISQFGNPFVIISKSKKVKLSDLYPIPIK